MGYVTAAEVIQATGAQPQDFKLSTDDPPGLTAQQKLEQLLDRWIAHVKGEIDDHCGVDFLAAAGDELDLVHHTVKSVAERAAARWVNQVRSHRDSALIRLDEWRIGIDLVDEVLPRHLRDTLDRHMRSRRKLPFRGFVSRAGDGD